MKRTKLVYVNKNEDIDKKIRETMLKYHIKDDQILEIKYSEKDSNKNALIVYNS